MHMRCMPQEVCLYLNVVVNKNFYTLKPLFMYELLPTCLQAYIATYASFRKHCAHILTCKTRICCATVFCVCMCFCLFVVDVIPQPVEIMLLPIIISAIFINQADICIVCQSQPMKTAHERCNYWVTSNYICKLFSFVDMNFG